MGFGLLARLVLDSGFRAAAWAWSVGVRRWLAGGVKRFVALYPCSQFGLGACLVVGVLGAYVAGSGSLAAGVVVSVVGGVAVYLGGLWGERTLLCGYVVGYGDGCGAVVGCAGGAAVDGGDASVGGGSAGVGGVGP